VGPDAGSDTPVRMRKWCIMCESFIACPVWIWQTARNWNLEKDYAEGGTDSVALLRPSDA
jgi:hypothetical protein